MTLARRFLSQPSRAWLALQETLTRVERSFPTSKELLEIEPSLRQSVAIARELRGRLQNLCPGCFSRDCCCRKPLETSRIGRLFVLTHHKEIGLEVDTAKTLLLTVPNSRLVVGGIGPEYQESMREMTQALSSRNCFVLFPTDNAKTVADSTDAMEFPLDLVVLDGTWEQARKLHRRYIPLDSNHLLLTDDDLRDVAASPETWQARHHPSAWRQISTLEATRRVLSRIEPDGPWEQLKAYQRGAEPAEKPAPWRP